MKRPEVPGYMRRILGAYRVGAIPPGVADVTVRHDDWCALLAGRGPCDCEPDIEIGPDIVRGSS